MTLGRLKAAKVLPNCSDCIILWVKCLQSRRELPGLISRRHCANRHNIPGRGSLMKPLSCSESKGVGRWRIVQRWNVGFEHRHSAEFSLGNPRNHERLHGRAEADDNEQPPTDAK